jgi:hypothetical protein
MHQTSSCARYCLVKTYPSHGSSGSICTHRPCWLPLSHVVRSTMPVQLPAGGARRTRLVLRHGQQFFPLANGRWLAGSSAGQRGERGIRTHGEVPPQRFSRPPTAALQRRQVQRAHRRPGHRVDERTLLV